MKLLSAFPLAVLLIMYWNSLPAQGGSKAMTVSDKIYTIVEEMPRFLGCEDQNFSRQEKVYCAKKKLNEFLKNNMRYPEAARSKGIEGTVIAQVIVEKNGSLSNINLLQDIGGGCGQEALRLLGLMKNKIHWRPGYMKGQPVRVKYSLPIKFNIN